jgi:spore coat polysaccharide biosynthesis protein SpsF
LFLILEIITIRLMKRVAIIQARMSSTRLPGKVLKEVEGKPLLLWMLERVKGAKRVDEIVVATSTNPEDDSIVAAVQGVALFRGSLDDVLSRFQGAAEVTEADVVIRLTADCPLIDPRVIDEAIALYETGKYEYVTNGLERTYPKGMDVEVFSRKCLDEMGEKADDPYEREHVTPYLYQGKRKTKIGHLKQKEDDSDLRVTVDTPEDFIVVKSVIESLGSPGLEEIVSYLREKE